MRPTGIALAVIGMAIGVFSLFAANGGSSTDAQPRTSGGSFPDLSVPMVVAVVAVIVGVGMFLYGGRGYFVARNPAVRN